MQSLSEFIGRYTLKNVNPLVKLRSTHITWPDDSKPTECDPLIIIIILSSFAIYYIYIKYEFAITLIIIFKLYYTNMGF